MSEAPSSLMQSLPAVRTAVREELAAALNVLATGTANVAALSQVHWQAAHTAIQRLGHRALEKYSGELGALIAAAAGDVKGDRAAAFAKGSDALIDYMASLIAGRRDQPLRLFADYEALQQARGIAQPNRGELFFPDMTLVPDARADAAPMSADELRATRRQLEGALLPWMRKPDNAGLQTIGDVVNRVDAAQHSGEGRRLWWVARAVLDAVLHGGLEADAQVRRLLMQLNLHLGRLVQGQAETPEPLLRDALYLAALAQPVTPLVDEVQQRFRLRGALDMADAAPAAGFSAETLAAARGAAQGLQDLWSDCAAGNGDFSSFAARTRALADACGPLGEADLTALAMQLADTAGSVANAGDAARDAPVLEGACAVLMIDHVLAADHAPDAGFAARARNMVARLQASVRAPDELRALPPAQWLDEAAQQAQVREQDIQVKVEIERDLSDIGRALQSWTAGGSSIPLLSGLDKPLQRVSGAFAMLGHDDAAQLAGCVRDDLARHASGVVPREAEQTLQTRRVSALAAFAAASKLGPAQLETVEPIAASAVPVLSTEPPVADLLAVPEAPAPQAALAEPLAPAAASPVAPAAPVDGADGTDPEMLEIFLDEATEVLQTLADTVPQSRAQPQDQELLTTLRRAFHTLKGSGRMVGLKHLGEAAWVLEQVFNERSSQQLPGTPDLYRLVETAREKFSQWVDGLRADKQASIDAGLLSDWARRLRAGEALPVETAAEPPVADLPEIEVPAVEVERPGAFVQLGDLSVSRPLYDIMLPEARQTLVVMDAENRRVPDGGQVTPDYVRAAHTLSGIAGTAGMSAIRSLAASLERVLETALNAGIALPAAARDLTARAVTALHEQVAAIAAFNAPAHHDELSAALDALDVQPETPQPAMELLPAIVDVPLVSAAAVAMNIAVSAMAPAVPAPPPAAEPAIAAPPPAAAAAAAEPKEGERRRYRVNDDIDPQLLPIFLEEAAELVPQVGQDLRAWRARPDDKLVAQSLKRLLHTLKGSARMAGAMALGQLTHGMESRIENAQRLPALPAQLIDELENSFDRIGALIAELQQGEPAAGAADAANLTQAMVQMSRTMQVATASGAMTQLMPAQIGADGEGGAGQVQGLPRPMIRVRADLIDHLANQAGEVSIARARVSAELRSARTSLRELTENISRLRAQLRELEIQAETQMQSRFSPAPEQSGGQFDPLEFDRFTRLQELTRLMAESVNDVATVQHSLARDLDEGEKALAAQAQTTRDVQQDLMAIRMVPFASISDRLYRVTRLSARDAEKRVGLDIVGEQVEVDRSVMDRIAAPIEHLLRNAIVHGIEAPQRRVEIGKPEAGALKLEVRQEGNEIALLLSDDGDGLDIARIREKAIGLEMMREDEPLTDQQIANFIFRSGFSTANVVTTEAGRGVGMDVVMSEVTALGGRVSTQTGRGKGTQFTIHLPQTLSVLQAVVMRLAGNAYAVPTLMVEQVQRLKSDVLAAAHAARQIEWQDTPYPFYHLARLLDMEADAETPQYGSVLLLRTGANRAAIQVDDIVGGQEIVIKNIGPQLARVPGVTGAAVLGSGETVLILNPLLLTARHLEQSAAAAAAQALHPSGAAAQPASRAEPERQRIVLVVDDSLTVRKITDRLLTREGYRVVVAKDGVEALEKLRDQLPDVVITDVEMPRMDGFDLVRNVRADEVLKGLPVIMITSRTAEKHRQHASEIGVDVFLGKPYEEGELLGHIATLAAR